MRKPTFIVLSVINYKDKPLSYSKVRSKYSPQEREEQTIATIESIRKHAPDAHIVLVEAGLKKDLQSKLVTKADEYVYVGDVFWVRKAIDSKYKGIGEAVAMLCALDHIHPDSDFCFKISGRYFLNDHFKLADWQSDCFVALMYGNDISTRLYGCNTKQIALWKKALRGSVFGQLRGLPIEHTIAKHIPRACIKALPKIGVSGLGSAFGESFDE